jgi:HSP20 family protein
MKEAAMFLMNRAWNPSRDIARLRDEIDHLFSGASGTVHEFPAVNFWTQESGAVLTAELPGLSAEDVEIHVVSDTVTIKGQRTKPELKDGEVLHRNERAAGSFARTLKIPFHVDGEKVEATFRNGVLTLTLPRASADLPRKIAVKAA